MRKAEKRALTFAVTALCLLATGILVARVWWARMPRHAGKPVPYWFDQAVANPYNPRATSAFRAMGPAAVPYLVRFLKEDPGDSRATIQLKKALNHLPGSNRIIYRLWARFETALSLLEAIGPKAVGARKRIDELLDHRQILSDYPKWPGHDFLQVLGSMGLAASNSTRAVARQFVSEGIGMRGLAVDVFAAITPQGSPDIELLHDAIKKENVRASEGLPALAKLKANYRDLIPILVKEVYSTNHSDQAIRTSRQMKLIDEVLVPYSEIILNHPNPTNRAFFLKDLGKFGPRAIRAVPAIVSRLDDPSELVRIEATNALRSIYSKIPPAVPETGP